MSNGLAEDEFDFWRGMLWTLLLAAPLWLTIFLLWWLNSA